MKRYTITPRPRKSVKLNQASLKPTLFPRMTLATEDTSQKETRNARDKAHKTSCIENVMRFLTEHGYEGTHSHKILGNPSNKDFQNIFRFIYSFIDPTPFLKFEEDVLCILKLLKYPYCNEINRSQLSAITPHGWPVVLSMMSWVVDIVGQSGEDVTKTETIDGEFLEYVCEGYLRFMEGEDEDDLDKRFMEKVEAMHSKELGVLENHRKEVGLVEAELNNLRSKFEDLSKLEERKKRINEDLNALIQNDKQLEQKKAKYMTAMEKIVEDIASMETQIDELMKTKSDLTVQINSQTVNPRDIKEMNIEKFELFKELERLKPIREGLAKALKAAETAAAEIVEENEKLLIEISSMRGGLNIDRDTFSYALTAEFEAELALKKENVVNYELTLLSLEDKIREKEAQYKDLEEQYSHINTKLQTIGSIYLEKKELSERSHQKNRNEIDRLENELLKLKLESDSVYLKSEKDCSEAKIKLDIQSSVLSKEKEEIARLVWEFYNTACSMINTVDQLEKDFKKIQK